MSCGRRADTKAFADYCEQRWGWQKSTSYEMATGGAVVAGLLNSGIPESAIPESTSALNAIAQAPAAQQPSVLKDDSIRRRQHHRSRHKAHPKSYTLTGVDIALWSQIGTVNRAEASHPEKLKVTSPVLESPLLFDTITEAQAQWEADGQRLCAAALGKFEPDHEMKATLTNVPVKITSSGRTRR